MNGTPPSTTTTGTLLTTYTYDYANHLTNVYMPRGGPPTQNRTFAFDPVTLRLTGSTSPETGPAGSNGITLYTYNADGTLATRTDPKSQVTSYSYDAYQRVTKVTHGSDTSQTVNYYYDADPLDTGGMVALEFSTVDITPSTPTNGLLPRPVEPVFNPFYDGTLIQRICSTQPSAKPRNELIDSFRASLSGRPRATKSAAIRAS